MKIIEVVQGSPEWYAAKCGIPSASNFDKIVTASGEPSKQRDKYLHQLACEKITKRPTEEYSNANMERGQALEEEGRAFYRLLTGKKVTTTGFWVTEGKFIVGCSPDSLVDKNGLNEIKCPLAPTHVLYLLNPEKLERDYWQQCQGQLLVTGRKWVDLMSYYPGMRSVIARIKPHKKFQGVLVAELRLFCAELDKLVRKIK
jgi:hypothetical protein